MIYIHFALIRNTFLGLAHSCIKSYTLGLLQIFLLKISLNLLLQKSI